MRSLVTVTVMVRGAVSVLVLYSYYLWGVEQGGAGEEEPDAPFMDAVVKVLKGC